MKTSKIIAFCLPILFSGNVLGQKNFSNSWTYDKLNIFYNATDEDTLRTYKQINLGGLTDFGIGSSENSGLIKITPTASAFIPINSVFKNKCWGGPCVRKDGTKDHWSLVNYAVWNINITKTFSQLFTLLTKPIAFGGITNSINNPLMVLYELPSSSYLVGNGDYIDLNLGISSSIIPMQNAKDKHFSSFYLGGTFLFGFNPLLLKNPSQIATKTIAAIDQKIQELQSGLIPPIGENTTVNELENIKQTLSRLSLASDLNGINDISNLGNYIHQSTWIGVTAGFQLISEVVDFSFNYSRLSALSIGGGGFPFASIPSENIGQISDSTLSQINQIFFDKKSNDTPSTRNQGETVNRIILTASYKVNDLPLHIFASFNYSWTDEKKKENTIKARSLSSGGNFAKFSTGVNYYF